FVFDHFVQQRYEIDGPDRCALLRPFDLKVVEQRVSVPRCRSFNLGIPLPHGVGPFFAKSRKAASLALERVSSLLRANLALINSINLEQLLLDLWGCRRDWTFAIPVHDRCPDHVAHVSVAAIDDVTPGVGCLSGW